MELFFSAFMHSKLFMVFPHLSEGESCLKTKFEPKDWIMKVKQRSFETEFSLHPFANHVTGRE